MNNVKELVVELIVRWVTLITSHQLISRAVMILVRITVDT